MAYSDETREGEPFALPDVEHFHVSDTEAKENGHRAVNEGAFFDEEHIGNLTEAGWYWWACFPGCLPHVGNDGEPWGPFETEAEAIEDALRRAERTLNQWTERLYSQGGRK
jgi:hypothetical protein